MVKQYAVLCSPNGQRLSRLYSRRGDAKRWLTDNKFYCERRYPNALVQEYTLVPTEEYEAVLRDLNRLALLSRTA